MIRKIDDVSKRKQYKKEQYGDRKSRLDDYTGERVFSGNVQDSKYRHPSNKTSDTDHITPIKVVQERYKYLTEEQQKKLANNIHNYATVNSKLNRSKGDLENHQYLYRQARNGNWEDLKTSARMINKEIESRAIMRAEATIMYAQNTKEFIMEQTERFISEELKQINAAGLDEATSSALFAATLSVTKNVVLVCKDEENLEEALKQIIIDTSSSAVLGYAAGSVKEILGMEDVSLSYLLVNSSAQISKQMVSYVNGSIDERQLVENIAESSMDIACAYIGKNIGALVGNMMLPGVGRFIGQYIGEVITTSICTEVISTIKYNREFKKRNSRLIKLYNQAECEIREAQIRLKELADHENKELISAIQSGFDEIRLGIEDNSYSKILSGLSKIGMKFGIKKSEIEKEIITKDNLFSKQTIMFD